MSITFENIKLLKDWLKLAKPNKKLLFMSAFAVILAYTCVIIAPIYSAKVIVAINGELWGKAAIYLTVVFALLALRNVFWYINYVLFSKIIKSVYVPLNNQFVQKMLKAKSINFKETSKEKLLNILHTEIYNLSDSVDKLAICIGRIFMLIVTIIIIFVINPWVGLAVLVCDIINFIFLNWLEVRRAKTVKRLREDHDRQYEIFSEIVDTRQTINDFNLNEKLKDRYNRHLNKYIFDLHKKTMADSSVSQGFFVFYNALIFALTLGMVFLASQGGISIEMYFVIVPYITNGIETTNQVFEFMPYLKNTGIYTQRVKNVLNFVEKENIDFGDVKNDDVIGYITFDEVNYNGDNEGTPPIKDINLHIKGLQTTLIIGSKSSGKRTLFRLMHRDIKPSSGQICLDGIDIFSYNKKVFTTNFNYLNTHPTFFKGSILENLKLVNKDKKQILYVLEKLGMLEYIETLPHKIYTNVLSLPFEKQYMIGLARTILTNSEIIAIYEFPSGLSQDEKDNIARALNALWGKRTIVVFSARDNLAHIADKVVTVEKGKIQNIAFTNNRRI